MEEWQWEVEIKGEGAHRFFDMQILIIRTRLRNQLAETDAV